MVTGYTRGSIYWHSALSPFAFFFAYPAFIFSVRLSICGLIEVMLAVPRDWCTCKKKGRGMKVQ